jgi:hypothetical protein
MDVPQVTPTRERFGLTSPNGTNFPPTPEARMKVTQLWMSHDRERMSKEQSSEEAMVIKMQRELRQERENFEKQKAETEREHRAAEQRIREQRDAQEMKNAEIRGHIEREARRVNAEKINEDEVNAEKVNEDEVKVNEDKVYEDKVNAERTSQLAAELNAENFETFRMIQQWMCSVISQIVSSYSRT